MLHKNIKYKSATPMKLHLDLLPGSKEKQKIVAAYIFKNPQNIFCILTSTELLFYSTFKLFFMPQTIAQKVVFKNTEPKALYDLYMNAKKHSVATAAPAKITGKIGDAYTTHGGYIYGVNTYLVKDKLIIQTWRTKEWEQKDADSTLIISLEEKGKNTVLHMIHVGVPDKHAESINKGWDQHYWQPWKKYLAGKPIDKHPAM
jgi:hypothetical protein